MATLTDEQLNMLLETNKALCELLKRSMSVSGRITPSLGELEYYPGTENPVVLQERMKGLKLTEEYGQAFAGGFSLGIPAQAATEVASDYAHAYSGKAFALSDKDTK